MNDLEQNNSVPITAKPTTGKLTVSLLIPCWNEEATIERSVLSCLSQETTPDQIIIVDDSSIDSTPEILARYADRITVVRTPKNSGNKSHAQEYGLGFVTSDIVITTDADTILHPQFVTRMMAEFADPNVAAVSGYVRSLKHNWLTRCRALDYAMSQNIYKVAQSYIDYMFVISGAAGAFRTAIFRQYLTFDHDTITEDLDFTNKLHKNRLRIAYTRDAIVYTQDPANLHSYINQIRRWYGGGFQNIMKHKHMLDRPAQALQLSLMYVEGLIFSSLFFILPILDIRLAVLAAILSVTILYVLAIYAAFKERRIDMLLAPIPYALLMYVNAYIFLEQFVKQVILKRNSLSWFKPERLRI